MEKWFVELNSVRTVTNSVNEIQSLILSAESFQCGRLWLGRNGGHRPWWHRLFGLTRFTDSLFALEWFDNYASLIFYDENDSEFRALDQESLISISDETKSRISHGNTELISNAECIHKQRAFKAIQAFLDKNEKSKWFEYRFVK